MTPCAIVLAGGRSKRLGQDKALLRLTEDGPTLIERVVSVVRAFVSEVIVVSGNAERLPETLGARLVPDFQPNAGALGGICAGLRAAHAPEALLLSCDLPFLSPALLRLLIEKTIEGSFDADLMMPMLGPSSVEAGLAALLFDSNRAGEPPTDRANRPLFEPLVAVYSRRCLRPIERALGVGERKILSFLHYVDQDVDQENHPDDDQRLRPRIRLITETEIRKHDPDLLSFLNINTPDDLARARKILRERESR